MRIVAGTVGGRIIESPHGHRTHPMGEKQRGALFNILGDIDGLTMLDAYCGSGACAIEAVSRGAAQVLALDIDQKAYKTTVRNVQMLGLRGVINVIQANCGVWSDEHEGSVFDIVLCDPPYDAVSISHLQKLSRHVAQSGVLVVSLPKDLQLPEVAGMQLVKEKTYAEARIAFYKMLAS